MLAYHAIEQQATFHAFDIDQLRARTSSAPNAWRRGLAWILAETGNKQAAQRELDLLADAGGNVANTRARTNAGPIRSPRVASQHRCKFARGLGSRW